MAGTIDLNEITLAEYLQVAFIHAMSNGVVNVEQSVMYGGQLFNVHLCLNKIGPSESLDSAFAGEQ